MQIEMKKDFKNTQERRNFFRVDLIRRVRYKISGLTSIECFTQNISEGGLCLLLGEELFPGTSIRAEFALPGKKPKLIKAYAVVVWQKDYLTGAKFVFQKA
jgi:c-di-GMP-binding flagellar brake protein YcgR